MEFSVCSLSTQEPGGAAGEPRQPCRAAQGSKAAGPDALGPGRKEEEAPFWKIRAQAEFPSLTPSQIKSMEKGEKALQACHRQEPAPKDREAKAERPGHLRQEPHVLPSASVEHEGPQPVQAYSGMVDEATGSEPVGTLPAPEAGPEGEEDTDALFSDPGPPQVGDPFIQGDLGKPPTGQRAADALPRPLPVSRGFGVRPVVVTELGT